MEYRSVRVTKDVLEQLFKMKVNSADTYGNVVERLVNSTGRKPFINLLCSEDQEEIKRLADESGLSEEEIMVGYVQSALDARGD